MNLALVRSHARFGAVGLAVALVLSACATGSPQRNTLQRIQSEGVVRVGFAFEPPESIAQPDGTVTGGDVEVVRAVMTRLGVKTIDFVLMPFDAQMPSVKARRIEVISGLYIRPTRCQEIAFSDPSTIIANGLLVKKGNPLNIHSYADIAANPEAIYGTIQGGSGIEFAEVAGIPKEKVVLFADHDTMFRGLQTDRVNVVGHVRLVLDELLKKYADPSIDGVEPFDEPLNKAGKTDIGYISAGFHLDDTDLVEAYNKELNALKEGNKLLEIVEPFGFSQIAPVGLTAEELCKQ